jgi:hypothetical protein
MHIYRAPGQPATRYKIDLGIWIKHKPTKVIMCGNCLKRRQAKNLVVQCYYDGDRFYCKKGCKE